MKPKNWVKKSVQIIPMPGYSEWLASRPLCVQELLKEFPPNTQVCIKGVIHYVIGADESDNLIISCVDPCMFYDLSRANETKIHAKCLREAT